MGRGLGPGRNGRPWAREIRGLLPGEYEVRCTDSNKTASAKVAIAAHEETAAPNSEIEVRLERLSRGAAFLPLVANSRDVGLQSIDATSVARWCRPRGGLAWEQCETRGEDGWAITGLRPEVEYEFAIQFTTQGNDWGGQAKASGKDNTVETVPVHVAPLLQYQGAVAATSTVFWSMRADDRQQDCLPWQVVRAQGEFSVLGEPGRGFLHSVSPDRSKTVPVQDLVWRDGRIVLK